MVSVKYLFNSGIILIFTVLLLAASCKNDKTKQEVTLLVDSMDRAWNNMTKSDDQKFQDIKRLLEEVSYTNNYNTKKQDSLLQLHQKVLTSRYNAESIKESNLIDDYDNKTNLLIKETFDLVRETPEIESHPIAKTLAEDITKADNDLVLYRARYDRWVREYNAYLDKNGRRLKNLGAPFDKYSKRPKFELSN